MIVSTCVRALLSIKRQGGSYEDGLHPAGHILACTKQICEVLVAWNDVTDDKFEDLRNSSDFSKLASLLSLRLRRVVLSHHKCSLKVVLVYSDVDGIVISDPSTFMRPLGMSG